MSSAELGDGERQKVDNPLFSMLFGEDDEKPDTSRQLKHTTSRDDGKAPLGQKIGKGKKKQEVDEEDLYVHQLFFERSDNLSIVDFSAVVKNTLGLELKFDDLQALFACVAGDGGIQWKNDDGKYTVDVGALVSKDKFDDWWGTAGDFSPVKKSKRASDDVGLEDLIIELRKLIRIAGIFNAAREALSAFSTSKGPEALMALFNRIDAASLEMDMKLTFDNLYALSKDLGIEMDPQAFEIAVNEIDPPNHGKFVNYKAFEDWWRMGSRQDASYEDDVQRSAPLRSMLRIGGLLASQSNTVSSALTGAMSIVNDVELMGAIDVALNSITSNSSGHVGHLLEAAQHNISRKTGSRAESNNAVQKVCRMVTESVVFEVCILACILVNLLALIFIGSLRVRIRREDQGLSVEDAFVTDKNQAESVLLFLKSLGYFFNGIFTN